MPDTLNKQSLINLLIDSPLREPIKINLIDIVNNTSEPDLPKVYSTITKELEIFQKATERRMKLADETITKLSGGTVPPSTTAAPAVAPSSDATTSAAPMPQAPAALPPLDLPPLPQPPVATPSPVTTPAPTPATPSLTVPPLDLPPMPTAVAAEPAVQPVTTPVAPPVVPPMQPLGAPAMASTSDEDALAEIQKELDSLKTSTASEIQTAAAPAPAPQA